jgi:hypothetical protein
LIPFNPETSVFSSASETLKNENIHDYNFVCGLYEFGTWYLILREEHRLRMYENRLLRRIFGPKRDEVTGWCRNLHNEELHNLYSWYW